MTLQSLDITHASPREWHEAFIRYVPQVFRRASFRGWYDLVGWDRDYCAFAIAEGSEIIASASAQRMKQIVRGREVQGVQLGAVGVLPQWRGRGLQRQIMARLLESTQADDLVFLFANDTVLDFYPKFGFRRVVEQVFVAQHATRPSGASMRRLSLTEPRDLRLLLRIAAKAKPITEQFGARDYGKLLVWYWTNYFQDCFFCDEPNEIVLVARQEQDCLHVFDVVAPHTVRLQDYLPRIATSPANRIEFGFTPDILWPDARPAGEYTDSPLFIRGNFDLPSPGKYPVLAQT